MTEMHNKNDCGCEKKHQKENNSENNSNNCGCDNNNDNNECCLTICNLLKVGLENDTLVKFIKGKYGKDLTKIIISNTSIIKNPRIILEIAKFINCKIDEMCVTCCVKETMKNKINDLTYKFFEKLLFLQNQYYQSLDPQNNTCENSSSCSGNGNGNCNCEMYDCFNIILCGKIYIALSSNLIEGVTFEDVFEYEVTLDHYFKMVFSILYLSFSSKCCCNEQHQSVCDCEMDFNDMVKFLFSFFCFFCLTVPQ